MHWSDTISDSLRRHYWEMAAFGRQYTSSILSGPELHPAIASLQLIGRKFAAPLPLVRIGGTQG